jgi:hypothetical protein
VEEGVVAQLTLYLDDESIRKIGEAAARENSSVSRWVKARLLTALETQWPPGYLHVFDSLKDADLERPRQPDARLDARRESP